jgi:hypothetical protein
MYENVIYVTVSIQSPFKILYSFQFPVKTTGHMNDNYISCLQEAEVLQQLFEILERLESQVSKVPKI